MRVLSEQKRRIKYLFSNKRTGVDNNEEGYVEGYNQAIFDILYFIRGEIDMTEDRRCELIREFQVTRQEIKEGY